jgi:hypothetical protein
MSLRNNGKTELEKSNQLQQRLSLVLMVHFLLLPHCMKTILLVVLYNMMNLIQHMIMPQPNETSYLNASFPWQRFTLLFRFMGNLGIFRILELSENCILGLWSC